MWLSVTSICLEWLFLNLFRWDLVSIDRLELGWADLVGDWTHPEASGLQVGHGHRQVLAEKAALLGIQYKANALGYGKSKRL